jgi:hypothetical protein
MKSRPCSRQADTSQQNGAPSQYIDPRYNPNPQQQFNPGAMAQQAQDPNHPANPGNPKVLIFHFPSAFLTLEYLSFLRHVPQILPWN